MATAFGNIEKTSNSKLVQLLNLWIPVIVWAGVIFYFSSMPNLRITPDNLWDFILRKGAHMVVYAVLQVLLMRALGRDKWWLALVLTLLYAGTDEWHQTFVKMRHGTPTDILYDSAGALIGLTLYKIVRPQKVW